MNTEAIYIALKDYVELGINATAGVPDTALKVEMADGTYGEDWTGIRMSKLPTGATPIKRFIDGSADVALTYQLISKQENDNTEPGAIAYSTYLEQLAWKLREMFQDRVKPDLPDGAELRGVGAVQQSTMSFASNRYTGYLLDLRFVLRIRRY